MYYIIYAASKIDSNEPVYRIFNSVVVYMYNVIVYVICIVVVHLLLYNTYYIRLVLIEYQCYQ